MMRRQLHPLFLLFLAMAAFGLIIQLITSPLQLFYSILLYAAVILIFVAIYRYIIKKQLLNSQGHRKISSLGPFAFQRRQAPTISIKNEKPKQKKKRATNHPFKVIEGNKGKKKKPNSS